MTAFFPNETIDYEKLVNFLEKELNVKIYLKTIYMPKPQTGGRDFLWGLRDKLSYLGFCIKTKESIFYKDAKSGEKEQKCNFDVKISLDMYKLAALGKVDYIILLGSDIDYFEVLEEIHELGAHTIVLGFRNTISDIRNIADTFICFEEIKDKIMMLRKVREVKENREENGKILDKIKEENIKVIDEYWNDYYNIDDIASLKLHFIY